MRRKLTFAILLVAAAAIAATTGTSPRLARASGLATGAVTAKVPLPAVQQSGGEKITLDVTAPAGTLRVKTANDARLGNLAVVYVVGTPKKAGAHETVTVSVLIKRFLSRRLASREGDPYVKVQILGGSKLTIHKASRFKCEDLTFFDTAFETGRVKVSANGGFWTLVSGRDENEQPSPPEEVLDNVMAGIQAPPGCDFKPEGDDPGNT
jgi:hypothetical protein